MKYIFVLLILIFTIPLISCDKDECPLCHECECICPKPNSEADTLVNTHIDNDECPTCHECECICNK